jgi:hypothetical protein
MRTTMATEDTLENLFHSLEVLRLENHQLAAEVERLRAALLRIADEDVDPELRGRTDILMGIAWAALEHKSR